MAEDRITNGILGAMLRACARQEIAPGGCNRSLGECMSGAAAVVGRCASDANGTSDKLEDTDLQRVLLHAENLASAGKVLRRAIAWVECGRNGSARDAIVDTSADPQTAAANAVLTEGMRWSASAKPDRSGLCNGTKCLLTAAGMIERALPSASRLIRALGENDLKRIEKAAGEIEKYAAGLREAVGLVQEWQAKD